MHAATEVFRKVTDPAYFRALAPDLALGARASFGAGCAAAEARAGAIGPGGHAAVPGIVAPERAAAMARAIDALWDAGLPPLFAYVYDAFWEPLDALAAPMGASLGPHEALADVWAWRVPAEPGRAGWSAHRGLDRLERGEGGRPVTLNVWIPLGDVGPDDGCMWVVPLDQDPDYPDNLSGRAGAPRAIPLPAAAGTALAWDANALHWGGPMTERARGPRRSFSYTLRALGAPRVAAALPARLDHQARLDLVADMIGVYEPTLAAQPGAAGSPERIPEPVRAWAELTRALARRL